MRKKVPSFHHFAPALLLSFIALAPLAAQDSGSSAESESSLAFNVYAELLVVEPQKTAEELVSWVGSKGGYYLESSLDGLQLKVPVAHVSAVRSLVQENSEELLSFQLSSGDVRDELQRVRAGILSREENLERVLDYLDETDVRGTLALEQEINSLMREIESLRGRERVLINRIDFAHVNLRFSTRQPTLPDRQDSSFPWLNTLGLYRFIEEATN